MLGIETSCDETAAAVVEETADAGRPWIVRSNVVASQADIRREWGATAVVGGQTYPQEPIAETVTRLERFLRRRRGQRLLVVAHAAPIALLTQLAWGEKPVTEGQFWVGVGNCCPRWVKTTCAFGA